MAYIDKPSLKDIFDDPSALEHYGTKFHSGRYPWGSGEEPYQHSGDFLSRCEEMRRGGATEKEIAAYMNCSTTELRSYMAIAKEERKDNQMRTAVRMREEGKSLNEIAAAMGFKNDSSVRLLLKQSEEIKTDSIKDLAERIKTVVDEKGMIDVGVGVERELGVSQEKIEQALTMLNAEGYPIWGGGVSQATNPNQQTTLKIICPPGTEHKEIYNYDQIHSFMGYEDESVGEDTKRGFEYPASMDSKRLQIRYNEEGGVDMDGVIELRRGVQDLSLGDAAYSQVRIMVDNDRYLKGMAVYADDLPDGVDVRFNTNKHVGTDMRDVLKKVKDDPDNPFGSLIKENGGQSYYIDENGNKQLSLINKRADEGDWGEWSKALPSQFLSKQSMKLINTQLKLTMDEKQAEYDEIMSLTNPTVKKVLLKSFADDCDAAAADLKAVALPRQKYSVILPVNSLKDTEVYAPAFDDGETVALVRYPHAGTFEIPIVTVNNKNKQGQSMIGTKTMDAVGITKAVADRLSGADFDGDTVMIIPCNSSTSKVKITSTHPLEELKGFDPKESYGPSTYKAGTVKLIKEKSQQVQTEMGMISNLITDMTIKGANEQELARAVKHSMVVIDAAKHKLNYKQSEIDNDIPALKKKYQTTVDEEGKVHQGASTLISQAGKDVSVPKRRGSGIIDKETGKVTYKLANETYVDEKGKTKIRTQDVSLMSLTDDARSLSSGRPQEEAYAKYANFCKDLANQSRKSMVNTEGIQRNTAAATKYSEEVKTLEAKLNESYLNAPRERQAQIMAKATVNAKVKANPDMDKKEIKKAKQQAIVKAREATGAKRTTVDISDKEWEAIQSGAISETKLYQILNHTDTDAIRKRAMPKTTKAVSTAQQSRIKALLNQGYTLAEVAKATGVSESTVYTYSK